MRDAKIIAWKFNCMLSKLLRSVVNKVPRWNRHVQFRRKGFLKNQRIEIIELLTDKEIRICEKNVSTRYDFEVSFHTLKGRLYANR